MFQTRLVLAIAVVFYAESVAGGHVSAFAANCPERPACEGCGCKGGPGYRAPDGKCGGFKNLEKICGPYPHARCSFENAPGTGANKECALRGKPRKSKHPTAEG